MGGAAETIVGLKNVAGHASVVFREPKTYINTRLDATSRRILCTIIYVYKYMRYELHTSRLSCTAVVIRKSTITRGYSAAITIGFYTVSEKRVHSLVFSLLLFLLLLLLLLSSLLSLSLPSCYYRRCYSAVIPHRVLVNKLSNYYAIAAAPSAVLRLVISAHTNPLESPSVVLPLVKEVR